MYVNNDTVCSDIGRVCLLLRSLNLMTCLSSGILDRHLISKAHANCLCTCIYSCSIPSPCISHTIQILYIHNILLHIYIYVYICILCGKTVQRLAQSLGEGSICIIIAFPQNICPRVNLSYNFKHIYHFKKEKDCMQKNYELSSNSITKCVYLYRGGQLVRS